MKYCYVISLLVIFRPYHNFVYALHGRGWSFGWPHRHHFSGEALLLWVTNFSKSSSGHRILPHRSEEGAPGSHTKQYKCHQFLSIYTHKGLHALDVENLSFVLMSVWFINWSYVGYRCFRRVILLWVKTLGSATRSAAQVGTLVCLVFAGSQDIAMLAQLVNVKPLIQILFTRVCLGLEIFVKYKFRTLEAAESVRRIKVLQNLASQWV